MGRPDDPMFRLPQQARALVLELLAYAARVDGPLEPREVTALDAAAGRLGLAGRVPLPEGLPLDEGHLLPPPLDELSPLERRLAFGAAAWMVYLDGVESFVERAFLDFIADEAGLRPDEARTLRTTAKRVRRACGERVPLSVELDLLALELAYLYALKRSEIPPPAASASGLDERVAGLDELKAQCEGAARRRAP
ncbi:MAG TPA: hypothetical protein VFS43_37890 [Polyangiaceae bacterium]|nr:hypothetical protein [Polyangiaceae bacterium]